MAKKNLSKKNFFIEIARKIDTMDWTIQKAWEKRPSNDLKMEKQLQEIKEKITQLKIDAGKIFQKKL